MDASDFVIIVSLLVVGSNFFPPNYAGLSKNNIFKT
jgi:hypothetical protein